MPSSRALRGWSQMLVNQGAVAVMRAAVERLRSKRRGAGAATPAGATEAASGAAAAIHPFDVQFGVDTSGLIWGEELPSGKRSDLWSTAYYGIAPSVLRRVIEGLDLDHSRFTFVDIGSGKGRGVMLATGYPFREVIGVELAPELHAIALRNLEKFDPPHRECRAVRLLHMDAAEFVFPEGPLVLFFYHPFCKPVLKRVLRNLGRSLARSPREMYVIYINPELRKVLNRTPFLQKVSEEALEMAEEDQLADRVGSSAEECAVYRSRN